MKDYPKKGKGKSAKVSKVAKTAVAAKLASMMKSKG
jgi:hypothetical protein